MSQELYSASEARARLGNMASSTFHRLVMNGEIQKIVHPGKKHGEYSKVDVDRIAQTMGVSYRTPSTDKNNSTTKLPKLVVDWRRRNDLPAILALDMEVYRDEVIGKVDLYHAWWQKNPYITLIVFEDGKRERVLANITMLPLKEETILRILKGEDTDRDISPDEILSYEEGGEFTILAENAISRDESRDYLGLILKGFADFWCEQWPKSKVRRIYAQAGSKEGRFLIQKLYFGPLFSLADDAYMLDLEHENPSRFIRSFQGCIDQKARQLDPEGYKSKEIEPSKWFK
jgi:hypothetical protein